MILTRFVVKVTCFAYLGAGNTVFFLFHTLPKICVQIYYLPHPKDGESNVFSLFVSPHLEREPAPSHNTSYVLSNEGYPSGCPSPREEVHQSHVWGTAVPCRGYTNTPQARVMPPNQDRMRYPSSLSWLEGYPLPIRDRMGYSSPLQLGQNGYLP